MKCTASPRFGSGRKMVTGIAATALVLASLTACADSGSSSSGGGSEEKGTCKPEDVTLVQSGRGLENEYYVSVDAGAKAFAAEKGLTDKYQWIASDGDSSKQLSQIKSILANGGECVVLNVDANEASIVPSIVKEVDNAGAWLVTQWNTPEGLMPTADDPHWVAHMSVDGVPQGYDTAKALFEAMGGTGSIVALQGILDNAPAQERFEGLQKALAEYPNIKLLEDQTAGWDRTKGQDVTQSLLTKYGDQITGIWAASDSMGLGALAAVKGAGKTGKIKVSGIDGLKEALDAVADPDSGYVATTQSTAVQQGAYGLNIGFAAATGQIDPATEPANHRAFYLKPLPAVTADTVASAGDPADTSKLDFKDVFGAAGEQIQL
ncbi:sugar ABC transporter substrate-binding protein [Nakamurella sp. GG22]